MAAIFENAKSALIAAEGGYTNSPFDYGCETKYGISKRQYPHLNIKALTQQQAFNIIEQDFWNFYKLGRIADQHVANKVLLLLINLDPIKAGQIFQRAINGCPTGIDWTELDGIIGSKTIDNANRVNAFRLCDRLTIEAVQFYLHRTDEDPTQTVNLRSWIRRSLI